MFMTIKQVQEVLHVIGLGIVGPAANQKLQDRLKDFAAIQSVVTAKLLTKRRKIKIKVLIVVFIISI